MVTRFQSEDYDTVDPVHPPATYTQFEDLLEIIPRRSPDIWVFAELNARKKTFENWPLESKVSAESLAQDGFFYIGRDGTDDRVVCFSCGLGLNSWMHGDIPSVEHAKHSPYCLISCTREGASSSTTFD